MSVKQPALYFGVLIMTAGVVVAALGGGLFEQKAFWMVQWQHQAFVSLCHQIPERSFWIGGQPMAVCSRCIGIYSGFWAGWALLPLGLFINFRCPVPYKRVMLIVIGVNILDVLGNVLGFWQNTLISRLVMGWLAGLAVAGFFSGSFFTSNIKKKENYYGAITKSGT